MYRKLIPLAVAAALLSACGAPETPPAQQAAPAPTGASAAVAAAPAATPQFDTAISGELIVEGLNELPPGFELSVRLLDLSDPSQVPPVVAEVSGPAPSILPHRFSLPYDASKIVEGGRYGVLAALVVQGVPLYSSAAPAPVLTEGNGSSVSLSLVRGGAQADTQIAPTEKMKQDFAALERSIGGLKRIAGERITDDVTVGWDAFLSDAGVRFAREQVDFGDAGTASLKYAFKDGSPWVIVREQRGRTTWLGWNEAGELMLNEGPDGPIDAAEAERLRAGAAEVMAQAQARAG
ncbi:YbaY family lipoprotein [Aquimonas voraii]|uniref:Type III secretion system lipoprotein chaperone (YscW) n=1 Tax=Aquimonas voraii TaxID=265719 RepID=A0A1G6XZH9_9GAMM|nr:YbaY family lipoprotein [Aquimonas voraii]SDD83634.1 Type III secretion system lipoprotein chaperone (YscW) [Aquimonas voraii]